MKPPEIEPSFLIIILVVLNNMVKQAVKVWKTTNAAVKKAAKEAAEAVAVEAEQM
jgi:competence protein ComGC